MLLLAILWTDCAKETYVRQKSGAVCHLEEHGESLSSSLTDDQPTEETNLLLTAPQDDDFIAPVNNFPRDIINSVEILGEGIFGEVFVFHVINQPISQFSLRVISNQTSMLYWYTIIKRSVGTPN